MTVNRTVTLQQRNSNEMARINEYVLHIYTINMRSRIRLYSSTNQS